jgi:hypothetical protein
LTWISVLPLVLLVLVPVVLEVPRSQGSLTRRKAWIFVLVLVSGFQFPLPRWRATRSLNSLKRRHCSAWILVWIFACWMPPAVREPRRRRLHPVAMVTGKRNSQYELQALHL